MPASTAVLPAFPHNDDRIEALIAVIGLALLIFGLIEAERPTWTPLPWPEKPA